MTIKFWTSARYKPYAKFALFTFLLSFIVILLGAYTRLTDAGLSCPDWPRCYGFIAAPQTAAQLERAMSKFPNMPVNIHKAWTEMVHRYFAGTLGLLVLILSTILLLSRKTKHPKTKLIACGLLLLLGLQIWLGMQTVTAKLMPLIVVSHLVTGLSLLSLLWLIYLDLSWNEIYIRRSLNPPSPFFLWFGLLILSIQIGLGGWVSSHYAGLACIDFPYCNGQLFPKIEWKHLQTHLISIHMLHRIGAIITGAYLIFLAYLLRSHQAFRGTAIVLISLVMLQILLGVLNILWLRPVWVALAHHATAILLLLTLIAAIVKTKIMTEYRYDTLFT